MPPTILLTFEKLQTIFSQESEATFLAELFCRLIPFKNSRFLSQNVSDFIFSENSDKFSKEEVVPKKY